MTLLDRTVPHIARATNALGNPARPGTTMSCFDGCSVVNSSVTPGSNLGRGQRCSTRPSRPKITLSPLPSFMRDPAGLKLLKPAEHTLSHFHSTSGPVSKSRLLPEVGDYRRTLCTSLFSLPAVSLNLSSPLQPPLDTRAQKAAGIRK